MAFADQTLGCFLEQTLPHLQSGGVEDAELSRLDFLKLPALSTLHTSALLFECPLKAERKWVDLSLKIDPFSPYFSQSISSLQNAFANSPKATEWRSALRLLHSLQIRSGSYGIELDSGSRNCFEKPNLFIGTEDFQGEAFSCFAETLFLQLQEKPLSSSLKTHLDRYAQVCAEAKDSIFACGIMMARSAQGIRVHSLFNAFSSMDTFEERLKQIGYSASVATLSRLLKKFPQDTLKKIGLALDIGEEIAPTVGIERFELTGQPAQEEWAPLLSLLVKEGLASLQRVEECLRWVGGSRKDEGENYSLFVRKISHIKLTQLPDGKLQAKIYLRATHGLSSKL